MKNATRKASKTTTKTTKVTECGKCGYTLKMMKFTDDKEAKLTCPDCGWRPTTATFAWTKKQTIGDAAKRIQKEALKRANTSYTGAPIPATKVYQKDMSKQFKGVEAVAYAAINEKAETITYLNCYKGRLPASYTPAPYTFTFTAKTQKKLDEGWVEVDRVDWPSCLASIGRSRKIK